MALPLDQDLTLVLLVCESADRDSLPDRDQRLRLHARAQWVIRGARVADSPIADQAGGTARRATIGVGGSTSVVAAARPETPRPCPPATPGSEHTPAARAATTGRGARRRATRAVHNAHRSADAFALGPCSTHSGPDGTRTCRRAAHGRVGVECHRLWQPWAVDDTADVGARTVRARKLAGLTQWQLAERATVSLSLLRKVEQGDRSASPAFTTAVAGVLGLSSDALYGQPYAAISRAEASSRPPSRSCAAPWWPSTTTASPSRHRPWMSC